MSGKKLNLTISPCMHTKVKNQLPAFGVYSHFNPGFLSPLQRPGLFLVVLFVAALHITIHVAVMANPLTVTKSVTISSDGKRSTTSHVWLQRNDCVRLEDSSQTGSQFAAKPSAASSAEFSKMLRQNILALTKRGQSSTCSLSCSIKRESKAHLTKPLDMFPCAHTLLRDQ